jgi:hypothetical protein
MMLYDKYGVHFEFIQVQKWKKSVMDTEHCTVYDEVHRVETGAGTKGPPSYTIVELPSFHIQSRWMAVASTETPIGWHSTFLHVLESLVKPSHNFLILFADIVVRYLSPGLFLESPRESTARMQATAEECEAHAHWEADVVHSKSTHVREEEVWDRLCNKYCMLPRVHKRLQ